MICVDHVSLKLTEGNPSGLGIHNDLNALGSLLNQNVDEDRPTKALHIEAAHRPFAKAKLENAQSR